VISNRLVRIAGLVVGGAALVFALVPFTTSITLHDFAGDYPPTTLSCRSPLIEVTRPAPSDAGWFGYAPLTAAPPNFFGRPCSEPARNRLIVSAVGLFVAALLGWVSARIGGDPGPLRRRRWRPKPA